MQRGAAHLRAGAILPDATSLHPATRVAAGVTWRSAITRLLVDMTAVAQHRNCGDGGLLCACVASRCARALATCLHPPVS